MLFLFYALIRRGFSMSNPTKEKPCALVLGHSFVRRFKAFVNRTKSSWNLNLDDTCRVFLSGIGGRTVDTLMQFDLAKLQVLQPNVVVLEIGSNDLCDISSDPEAVGSLIITLINRLRVEFSVDWVVVCQTNNPIPSTTLQYQLSTLGWNRTCQQNSMLHFGDTAGWHDLR